ncbi:hypothetical protein JZ751_002387 [Albula glossodonta]|uniref:Serine/arginine repetitive matrix protein C-terminal domain-containing protein n=1 Tax=Albula glossodonta TaxID=121402 RepID=A0A8T2PII1_9TELE|nr:hypothetical protein JZ751_002387 [Albula glossodonta]
MLFYRLKQISQLRADCHGPALSSSGSVSHSSSSASPRLSLARTNNPANVRQEGNQDGARSSQGSDPDQARGQKSQDGNEPITACLSPQASLSPQLEGAEVATELPVPPGERASGNSRHRTVRFPEKDAGHKGTHISDSLPSYHSQAKRNKEVHHKKPRGSHSSQRHHRRRARTRHHSSSVSPIKHDRHTGDSRRRCLTHDSRQCGSSESSRSSTSTSTSRSRSQSREHSSQNKSPHARHNNIRDKDTDNHAPHDDTENRPPHRSQSYSPRSHHRSRSYSPIRKRRNDSPSFMEARRITSARKRPIPYYRPSPSSPSSLSSYASVYSYSRSRSPGRNHSYYSRGSSESPMF